MITQHVTAEQLAEMRADGIRYELVGGKLEMMAPAGGRHGRIAGRILKLLAIHVDANALGCTFAAETGFVLERNPDTVRAPDVAFAGTEKMKSLEDDLGFLPFAPDLAVEVLSPNDSFTTAEQKVHSWLDSGTRLVLVVEPETKTVHAYRSRSSIAFLAETDVLDVSDVIHGCSVSVSEFFPT